MSSLSAQEKLQRNIIRLFTEELAQGHGNEVVLEGWKAAGYLLMDVGRRQAVVDAQWEEQHDWLVLGVPLSEPPRPPTVRPVLPMSVWRRISPAGRKTSRYGASPATRHQQSMAVECPYCHAIEGRR